MPSSVVPTWKDVPWHSTSDSFSLVLTVSGFQMQSLCTHHFSKLSLTDDFFKNQVFPWKFPLLFHLKTGRYKSTQKRTWISYKFNLCCSMKQKLSLGIVLLEDSSAIRVSMTSPRRGRTKQSSGSRCRRATVASSVSHQIHWNILPIGFSVLLRLLIIVVAKSRFIAIQLSGCYFWSFLKSWAVVLYKNNDGNDDGQNNAHAHVDNGV